MTILISGGASGVGESVARRLVSQGQEVIVIDVAKPKEDLLSSPLVSWIEFDLKNKDYDEIISFLTEKRCVLEGLFIYAGCTGFSSLRNMQYETYRNTFDLNVWSALKLASIFADFCCPEGSSIVLTGSPHQEMGDIDRLNYALSKATFRTLNSHISVHYANMKIRCNLAVLGWTDTPGERSLRADAKQDLAKVVNQSKKKNVQIFQSNDYDINLTFLLSKKSFPMSGSIIDLTGGFRI